MASYNLEIILIYILFLIAYVKPFIIIPLKSTDELYFTQLSKAELLINNKEIINKIFLKYINNVLYTDLYLGEPNQKAIAFLSHNDYGFCFYEEYSTKELIELGANNYNFYSKNKSTTIIPTDEYNYGYSFWSYLSHEEFLFLNKYSDDSVFNIELFDNKKLTKTEKRINFIYTIRNVSKMQNNSDFINMKKKFEKEQEELKKLNFTNFSYFSIGLNFGTRNSYHVVKSFVEEFLSKKEISNKEWSIYYYNSNKLSSKNNNAYDTFLIMGSSPHRYLSNIFNEKEQFSTYSERSLFSNNPVLSFYEIFTKVNNNTISLAKFDKSAELNFNFGLIRAPWQAKTVLEEKFFKKLVEQGKCFESKLDKTEYSYYAYYYCDKNKINEKEIKSFPGIFFQHNEFSYIFELNSGDLFETFGDIIIFKMVFYTSGGWILGKEFLKKYMLSFDDGDKKIYFYNKNYDVSEDNNYNTNDKNKFLTIKIILIIVGVIIFGITGFFIGKCIYNKKKIVSHELDDIEDDNFVNEENKAINESEDKLVA